MTIVQGAAPTSAQTRDRAPTGNRENNGVVVSSVADHTNKKLPARAAHRVWGSPITSRPLIESRARATPRRARRRARRSQQTTAVVSLGAASRRPSSSTCGGGAEAEHTAQTTMSACGIIAWALSQDIVARTLDRAELSEPVSPALRSSRPSARAPARRSRQPRHARRSCLLARGHEERRVRVRHPVECFAAGGNCKSQRH